jgi:hypothetical protein
MRLFLVSIILKVLMSGLGMEDGLLMVVRCLDMAVKITYVHGLPVLAVVISTITNVRRTAA